MSDFGTSHQKSCIMIKFSFFEKKKECWDLYDI